MPKARTNGHAAARPPTRLGRGTTPAVTEDALPTLDDFDTFTYKSFQGLGSSIRDRLAWSKESIRLSYQPRLVAIEERQRTLHKERERVQREHDAAPPDGEPPPSKIARVVWFVAGFGLAAYGGVMVRETFRAILPARIGSFLCPSDWLRCSIFVVSGAGETVLGDTREAALGRCWARFHRGWLPNISPQRGCLRQQSR